MEGNIEKKNLYLSLLNDAGRVTVIVDSVQDSVDFLSYLSEFYGAPGILTIGKTFEDSELVAMNDSYKERILEENT